MIMQLGKYFMYALIILILFILFYSLFVGVILGFLHLLMGVFNLGF